MSFGIRNVVGGFSPDVQGDALIPYTLARTAFEHQQLARVLNGRTINPKVPLDHLAVEFGCGYGRNLPFLHSLYGTSVVGLERDRDLATIARLCCPNASVLCTDSLARTHLVAETASLVFSYTVLQHIQESDIADVAFEMRRVVQPGGLILIVEATEPESGHPSVDGGHGTFPRPVDRYRELFGDIWYSEPRITSPGMSQANPGTLMLFRV